MIMKSRYFTKIVFHKQAVGKVLCYYMVKYRLTLTYKVTIAGPPVKIQAFLLLLTYVSTYGSVQVSRLLFLGRCNFDLA